MKKICILDYGLGNIKSLYNAIKKIGYQPNFFSEGKYKFYDHVFIPGVGSYLKGSKLLKNPKILNFLKESRKDSNILGICLGMQLLLTSGYEGGKNSGLDFIKGNVRLLKKKNKSLILPFVGYKKVNFDIEKAKYLKKFQNQKFYFIHSFEVKPRKINILSHTKEQSLKYVSSIINNNIMGFQFHPEKSGEIGLEFIETIIKNN